MASVLSTGAVVDRYRVVSVLGEGGMAVVYLVEHDRLGTRHALKVLTVGNRDVQRRTLQEGRLQAALRHPNIVLVTDVLDIEGSPALLLEYVEGPPLDVWLRRYRPPLAEALAVFRGVLAGVKYAHDQGLIHRDLKPANILLQVTAAGVVPKVADFGLAKSLDPGNLRKTRTGATMGTPAYMAPEQIRDASTVDRRADVYALGCLLYELVCGRPPYDAPDILALFAQVSAGAYTPAEDVVSGLPPNVVAALKAALQGDPERRAADCGAFAALLFPGDVALLGGVTLGLTSEGGQVAAGLAASRPSQPPRGEQEDTSGTWSDNPVTDEVPIAPVQPLQDSVTSLMPRSPAPPVPWGRVGGLAGLAALLVGGAGLAGGAWLAQPGSAAPPSPPPVVVLPPAAVEAPPVVVPAPAPAAPVVPEPAVARSPTNKVSAPPVVEAPAAPPPEAPPAAPRASFTFTGATRVVLVGADDQTWEVGTDVPPRAYAIRAWFGAATEGVGAGKVTLGEGQQVALLCREAFLQCRK